MTEPLDERDPFASTPGLYQRLVEFSPDPILVVSSDGYVRYGNPQVWPLFGYAPGEIIGASIDTLIPERFHNAHARHRGQYETAPQMRPMGAQLELLARRKDGSEFPVDVMLSPIESGGEKFTLAVVRDVTQRNRLTEELRKSEERFRLLVDGARDYAIFMLDPQGNVSTWNPGAERIKGYRAEEIIGQHFSRFYTREDVERGKPKHGLDIAKTAGRYEDEGWRLRKDGSRFWANVIISALYKDGQLAGFSKVTRDFTDRKRTEDSLLRELGKVILSNLDLRQIFNAISLSTQDLAPYDYAAISLYDSRSKCLRSQALSVDGPTLTIPETLSPDEETPDGLVFSRNEELFCEQVEKGSALWDALAPYRAVGLTSACWLPLNYKGDVIGTLFLGSRGKSAFDSKDRERLLQIASQIAAVVDHAYRLREAAELTEKLSHEKEYLEEQLRTEYGFEEIVGQSAGMKQILQQVETVAPTDAAVLISGETGTGKELIARATHHLSPRRDRTFVKLNCSAIPLGLLESELFGHEKGAFTGAIAQRVGRLELAHKGTLFLDEIGDLPLELQPKLLRALQEKEIERLGGRRTIPVDVRLIAASNRDLTKMVKSGEFRSDLYYRLRVFPILLPPLRQRRGDIPLLVNYFLAKHTRRMGKPITTIPSAVMEALTKWHWPGNVRELENFIERAVILTQGSVLRAPLAELEELQEPEQTTSTSPLRETHLHAKERDHILRVLRETKGMIGGRGGAAEKLGLKRTTLNSKLQKLGIKREDYT